MNLVHLFLATYDLLKAPEHFLKYKIVDAINIFYRLKVVLSRLDLYHSATMRKPIIDWDLILNRLLDVGFKLRSHLHLRLSTITLEGAAAH